MTKHVKARGLARIHAAFGHSRDGLCAIWQREEAFRIEIVLLALSVPLALWIGGGWGRIALMTGSILLLIVVEILNSAIEAVVDRIGPEIHELSRIAKDLGSAAVLLTALFPATVWGAVLLDRVGLIRL